MSLFTRKAKPVYRNRDEQKSAEREELLSLRMQLARDKQDGKKRNDIAYWRERQLSLKYPDMSPGYTPTRKKYGAGAGLMDSMDERIETLRIQSEIARAQKSYLEGRGPSPAELFASGGERDTKPDVFDDTVSVRSAVASDAGDEDAARRRLAEKFQK